MSKEGPTSGERNGEVTRFSWIPYVWLAGGALWIGLKMQSLVWIRSQLRWNVQFIGKKILLSTTSGSWYSLASFVFKVMTSTISAMPNPPPRFGPRITYDISKSEIYWNKLSFKIIFLIDLKNARLKVFRMIWEAELLTYIWLCTPQTWAEHWLSWNEWDKDSHRYLVWM